MALLQSTNVLFFKIILLLLLLWLLLSGQTSASLVRIHGSVSNSASWYLFGNVFVVLHRVVYTDTSFRLVFNWTLFDTLSCLSAVQYYSVFMPKMHPWQLWHI